MKKSLKSIISLALCLILILGVSVFPVLAEGADINASDYTSLKYKSYVSLGDSIPWGFGLQDKNIDTGSPVVVGMRVEGSYSDLMAKVFEENNGGELYIACRSGLTLSDIRTTLEMGLGYAEPYYHENDAYSNRHPERRDKYYSTGSELIAALGEADLVTFQCGLNDVVGSFLNALCATGLFDFDMLKLGGTDAILEYLAEKLQTVELSADILTTVQATMYNDLTSISKNAEAIISEVVGASSEDTDIIIVGYYDVFRNITAIPGNESALLKLLSSILVSLNDYYSALADRYDNVYLMTPQDVDTFYADETPITDVIANIKNILRDIHPNAEGHEYIAKTLLDSLVELHVCHHDHVKTVSQTVRKGLKFGLVEVKVCTDCGKVISYGQLATPFGTYDIPEQTMLAVANSVASSVTSVFSKLASLFSKG